MHSRTGLTLIELVVALAIAGMLMSATLGAVTAVSRAHALTAGADAAASGRNRLRAVLTADLCHTERYARTPDGLSLRTRARLNAKTLEIDHIPATVDYRVRRIDGRPWLLRVQKGSRQGDLAEIMCPDVLSVDVRGLQGGAETEGKWKGMPDVAVVTVAFEGRPAVAFTIRTR